MPLSQSYFNVRQNKWYLTAEDAAEWTPGPCVVWEMAGQCPMGDKCTCAHLSREALDKKNKLNRLGNYVECTLPARCKYVLKQIKSGAWSNMKDIKPNAPCLVELLQWLPAQKGGEIDVDVVQSFISANKSASAEDELTEEEVAFIEECYQEVLDGETASIDDVEVDEEELAEEFENFQKQEEKDIDWCLWAFQTIAEMNDREIMQQNKAQLEVLRAEEQRLKLAQVTFAAVCRKVPAARAVKRALVDDMGDYEWEGMVEEARTSPLMWL